MPAIAPLTLEDSALDAAPLAFSVESEPETLFVSIPDAAAAVDVAELVAVDNVPFSAVSAVAVTLDAVSVDSDCAPLANRLAFDDEACAASCVVLSASSCSDGASFSIVAVVACPLALAEPYADTLFCVEA